MLLHEPAKRNPRSDPYTLKHLGAVCVHPSRRFVSAGLQENVIYAPSASHDGAELSATRNEGPVTSFAKRHYQGTAWRENFSYFPFLFSEEKLPNAVRVHETLLPPDELWYGVFPFRDRNVTKEEIIRFTDSVCM